MATVLPTADVAVSASIGAGTVVWHQAQVREDAVIGDECVIGRGVYVGSGVRMGHHCKLQNYALVYEPAALADGVFIGPAAVLTNDRHPRAITPTGAVKSTSDWQPVGVTVDYGASIGARAVCVAPLKIGAWAMIAAGAIVTRDVPDFALVVGSPARQIGWVGRSGQRLLSLGNGRYQCPATTELYSEHQGVLTLETVNNNDAGQSPQQVANA